MPNLSTSLEKVRHTDLYLGWCVGKHILWEKKFEVVVPLISRVEVQNKMGLTSTNVILNVLLFTVLFLNQDLFIRCGIYCYQYWMPPIFSFAVLWIHFQSYFVSSVKRMIPVVDWRKRREQQNNTRDEDGCFSKRA